MCCLRGACCRERRRDRLCSTRSETATSFSCSFSSCSCSSSLDTVSAPLHVFLFVPHLLSVFPLHLHGVLAVDIQRVGARGRPRRYPATTQDRTVRYHVVHRFNRYKHVRLLTRSISGSISRISCARSFLKSMTDYIIVLRNTILLPRNRNKLCICHQ